MYAALWNWLPGPVWVRAVTLAVAAVVLIAVLFEWAFPWVTSVLPYQEQTVV